MWDVTKPGFVQLFLQPGVLRDFQSFVGVGWEQFTLLGTVIQCPSKNNGNLFKVEWDADSLPSEWLRADMEGNHRNKAAIKQAVTSFANPKEPPSSVNYDYQPSLTTPLTNDNTNSVPNVLLGMNLPFSPQTQPRTVAPTPCSADRAQALANLRTAPSNMAASSIRSREEMRRHEHYWYIAQYLCTYKDPYAFVDRPFGSTTADDVPFSREHVCIKLTGVAMPCCAVCRLEWNWMQATMDKGDMCKYVSKCRKCNIQVHANFLEDSNRFIH